jgi:pimeloyl-ACP methyl ester carboxylesterase
MAAVSYAAMHSPTGPGLAPVVLPPAPPPDTSAEPAGFLVEAADAVRIHFLDWSGGQTAGVGELPGNPAGVLLIPGLATTAWSWAPVARRLARTCRVVAMDLRGHGLSDAPTSGYDPLTFVADAIAVAEGAGLLAYPGGSPAGPLSPDGAVAGDRIVLAGLGFGAIVAAWTARALGGQCAGLVLVDGGWEDLAATTGASPDEWLAAIEEPPEVLASMAAWLADREAFDPATWDADQVRAARAQVVEAASGRLKLAIHPHALRGAVEAMWSYEPAAVLPFVEASIVALAARDDDAGSRLAALRSVGHGRIEAGRPPISVAAFPARDHNLARYEPGAVAAAVLALAAEARP